MADKPEDLLKLQDTIPNAPKGNPANSLQAALYRAVLLNFRSFLDYHKAPLKQLIKDSGYKKTVPANLDEEIESLIKSEALVSPYEGAVMLGYGTRVFDARVNLKADSFVVYDDETSYELVSRIYPLPGDEVKVYASAVFKKAVVSSFVRAREYVLGFLEHGPWGPRLRTAELPCEIKVAEDRIFHNLSPHALVLAQITTRSEYGVTVRIVREITKVESIATLIMKAMLSYDINPEFPDNVKRAAKRVSQQVVDADLKGRVDLRDLPLVTIDGEDARDFDDAVYVKKGRTGYTLYVAIADVSYYVKPHTLLDAEALNRTTSVYFPYYVVPMLPVELSNGICSLNPGVDRLCMVCELGINRQGTIKAYKFYPAVMKSHARLTYNEAYKMITEGVTDFEDHKSVIEHVKDLYELYLCLKKARDKRGAVSIEGDETGFSFDESLEVDGIIPKERNDAHLIIEECMIAANVAAAEFVIANGSNTLFRVHAKPTLKKLEELKTALAVHAVASPVPDNPTSMDYAKIAKEIASRPDAKILSLLLLRSMSRALYSPDNIGHFGLALDCYCHFTSPIRRYPDLQLHRVIKHILCSRENSSFSKIGELSYTKEQLTVLGERCSDKENNATLAELNVDNGLKCLVVKRHIGDYVRGMVTATTDFGVFVNLVDFYIDGMIFVGDLPVNRPLESFKAGQLVTVRILNVDAASLKINLGIDDGKKGRVTVIAPPPLEVDDDFSPSDQKRMLEIHEDALYGEVQSGVAEIKTLLVPGKLSAQSLNKAALDQKSGVSRGNSTGDFKGSHYDKKGAARLLSETLGHREDPALGEVRQDLEDDVKLNKKEQPYHGATSVSPYGKEDDKRYPLKVFLDEWALKNKRRNLSKAPVEITLTHPKARSLKSGSKKERKRQNKQKKSFIKRMLKSLNLS